MTAITVEDLDNAKLDVDHIAEIATSLEQTATDRLGHTKLTVTGAMDTLVAFNPRGDWVTATAYAVKDLFSSGGITYVAVKAHTSTSIAADLAAGKIAIWQGVTSTTVDHFVAGVNFTPGTTTTLTLSRAPGSSPASVDLHFNSQWQAPENIQSIVGTTLTLTAPIPVGVTDVYVRIGITQSMLVPPPRSVGAPEINFIDILPRQADTVAQLKTLPGDQANIFETLGYYAAGDGGGAKFRKRPGDTTSADNNGTLLVLNDGTRVEMIIESEIVNARCFGVIPEVAGVGARLNQAIADHVGKYRLVLPWGRILTGTTIIDFPIGTDAGGVGPVNSNYGPVISQAPHGTRIVSAVPNDYAVRLAYNAPFVAGGFNFGNLAITNPVGKGLYGQSMGTGAMLTPIAVHDCLQEGAYFDYFQDSTMKGLEVVNCGADTSYGVTFATNCNACTIEKLLIVQCRQPLLVQDSTFFDFFAHHIEQGEYPGPPNDVVNCAYIAGGLQLKNCQHINFHGGVFVPNSTGFLASTYGIAESATPFYLVTDSLCKNIKLIGTKFSSPLAGSRFLSVTNVELIAPTFNNPVSKIHAVEGTNLKIRGGQAELYDDQSQTAMLFGFFAGRSQVSDFEIICSNPGSTTKLSGALLDGVVEVGAYKITVDKYFSHLGTNAVYRGPVGMGGIGYSIPGGGVVDIQKSNAGDAIIINTIGDNLRSLNNYHGQGGKYTVVNNTAGTLNVGTAGNISAPAPIAVPAFGSIDLKHIPGTNTFSPVV